MNDAPDQLNAALFTGSLSLAEAAASDPKWVSPLAREGYQEFWNERFLERLELLDDHLESFREFWPFKPWVNGKVSPRGTPHWDVSRVSEAHNRPIRRHGGAITGSSRAGVCVINLPQNGSESPTAVPRHRGQPIR